MAPPKRKQDDKAGSSKRKGKQVVEEVPKFVNDAAKGSYRAAVANDRAFISERGFDFGDDPVEGISDVIRDLGWEEFATHPDAMVE